MFERYTEKARRTIFFARYEASQFGCPYIETEHLLLGLFREDKALANQFQVSPAKFESIRGAIEQRTRAGQKIATSVDLPLSHECKRVLAYGAEEAQRMNHQHIGTAHLLLGLLREEKSFAAQLLREQGLALESARQQVYQSEAQPAPGEPAPVPGLDRWLADLERPGGAWVIKQMRLVNRSLHIAVYPADQPNETPEGPPETPAQDLAQLQKRIKLLMEEIERAIGNHEFEKARLCSDEERKQRQNLRRLCEKFNLPEPSPPPPLLCIEIIHRDLFSEVRKRCDEYIAEGVPEVWVLDSGLKRAYTVTKADGLREFQGEILRIANPPLEMDLRAIFD